MIDLARDGYTHEQIRDMLHARSGAREVRFRHVLLDRQERPIRELRTVESASIDYGSFATIKRTAKYRLREDADLNINWQTDRIASYIEYKMPEVRNRIDTFRDRYGLNLASWNRQTAWQAAVREGETWRLGGPGNSGFFLTADTFAAGQEYVLTFRLYLRDGTIQFIGGHSEGHVVHQVWLDGVAHPGSLWGTGEVPVGISAGNETTVTIHFTAQMNAANNGLYIQPNRGSGYSLNYNAEIYNIKLEEGALASPWSPAPENVSTYAEYQQRWMEREVSYETIPARFLAYPLGIFLLSSPTKVEVGGRVYRDIEAYDKSLIVKEDRVQARYTITAGTSYYAAMVAVLTSAGITKYNIENSGKTLPVTKEYEPGAEKLAILNDLASDLNFTPLFVDEYGFFRTRQYQSPQEAPEEYVYEDDRDSVTFPGIEEELDTFNLPNVFVVTATNPDTDKVLKATYTNRSPDHPRSTVNLGRQVVRHEEKDDIADQAALNSYVERLAFEASQIFGRVSFGTALMPFHGYANVLRIRNRPLGIDDKYAETSWSMELRAGGTMQHEVRKVVSLV